MMKLISWNVNGLRACVGKNFMDFFQEIDADIFCIQESKLQEGQIDLELTGFSGVSLEDLLSEPEVIDEEAEAEKVKMQKLELSERMDKAKYVFWAFSGGRDSTRALIATWEAFAATGKHCEVIYIENTCEFTDLIMHIKERSKVEYRTLFEVGIHIFFFSAHERFLDLLLQFFVFCRQFFLLQLKLIDDVDQLNTGQLLKFFVCHM